MPERFLLQAIIHAVSTQPTLPLQIFGYDLPWGLPPIVLSVVGHFQVTGPWTGRLTPVSLSFLMYKVEVAESVWEPGRSQGCNGKQCGHAQTVTHEQPLRKLVPMETPCPCLPHQYNVNPRQREITMSAKMQDSAKLTEVTLENCSSHMRSQQKQKKVLKNRIS